MNTANESPDDLTWVIPDDELVAPESDGADQDSVPGESDIEDDELPVDVL